MTTNYYCTFELDTINKKILNLYILNFNCERTNNGLSNSDDTKKTHSINISEVKIEINNKTISSIIKDSGAINKITKLVYYETSYGKPYGISGYYNNYSKFTNLAESPDYEISIDLKLE
jgi:hypothetical protein